MTGDGSGAYVLMPPCAEDCRRALVEGMAEMDTEVTATWVPPLFPSGYEPLNLRCPHGVLWFMEPTSEQRLHYGEAGESRG